MMADTAPASNLVKVAPQSGDVDKIRETVAELALLLREANEVVSQREDELLQWETKLQVVKRASQAKLRLATERLAPGSSKPRAGPRRKVQFGSAGTCITCDTIDEDDEDTCEAAGDPSGVVDEGALRVSTADIAAISTAILAEMAVLRSAWADVRKAQQVAALSPKPAAEARTVRMIFSPGNHENPLADRVGG